MTDRDWFAAFALSGICSRMFHIAPELLGRLAYEAADSMLAAQRLPAPVVALPKKGER